MRVIIQDESDVTGLDTQLFQCVEHKQTVEGGTIVMGEKETCYLGHNQLRDARGEWKTSLSGCQQSLSMRGHRIYGNNCLYDIIAIVK